MRALIASAVLCFAVSARADWASASVPGIPADVSPVDGGFLISTSTGVYRVSCTAAGCGAAATVFTGPPYASAFEVRGCIGGLAQIASSSLSWLPPGCGTTANVAAITATSYRTRATASGMVYATTKPSVVNFAVYANPDVTAAGSSWTPVSLGGIASYISISGSVPPLSVSQVDGRNLAVASGSLSASYRAVVLSDGGLLAALPLGSSSTVVDAQLYTDGGTPGALVVVNFSGTTDLRLVPDLFDGGVLNLSLPTGVTAARLQPQGGTANSAGFAMAAFNDGGLWGTVPNPARLGLDWRHRAGGPGVVLSQLECQGPQLCVAVVSSASANLWVYTNANLPGVDPAPVVINDGQANLLTVDAGDGDGDPVYLVWPASSGALTFSTPSVDGRQVTVDVPRSLTCGVDQAVVPVLISDGLAAHERTVLVNLTIDTVPRPASAPTVLPSPGSVAAGGAALTLTATAGAPACATTSYSWQFDGGPGGQLVSMANGSAVFTPPATLCQSAGADAVISAVASGPGGPSVPTSTTVHVSPWGRPFTPSFSDAGQTQQAGTTVTYAVDADGEHACRGASGFPQVGYQWSASTQLPGVQVTPGGGTITIGTRDCLAGPVDLTVVRQLPTPTSEQSDAGALHLDVVVALSALSAATPFDSGFAYDAGLVSGSFWVGANCATQRGLTADVSISAAAGVIAARSGLPVPSGPEGWAVPVSAGCNGGQFTFSATLHEADGGPAGPVDQRMFETSHQPAAVASVSTDTLSVACGAGARGQLQAVLAPDSCQSVELGWVKASGPDFTVSLGPSFDTVEVQSVSTQLESLVGQTVTFDVTADAGFGNASTAAGLAVRLVTEPFVQVRRERSPPTGSTDGLVTMAVTLVSRSDCAVSSLQLDETLGGLVFSEGSARLDGEGVVAASAGGVLRVQNVALPAHGTRVLTYAARAPLLSLTRPTAVASMHGYPVSDPEAPVQVGAGCSCSASTASLGWLAGLLVVLRARRRLR